MTQKDHSLNFTDAVLCLTQGLDLQGCIPTLRFRET